MTPYERIALWNQKAGKSPVSPDDEAYWVLLENQTQRIEEELRELRTALKKRNLAKLLDAGCDLEVVVSGLNYMCCLEYKSAIQRVLDNNELKVVKDRQLVEDSIEPYRQKGIETKIVEVTLDGESYYSLHRVEDDKILKLNNHTKVDLSDII
ncbi:MAG: hypothetical protein J7545_20630 [Roseofilum sp. SBFL]|uniref:hypothetical protein n=1 Tax=unclassified Roseofilum TaxID=2620099 RepID=UPI001B2C5386|nr:MULTISPECIES: hypothetical protein [unclassified Roseofilum]MBP0012782.1 hypothetical protein [Roseofilum sp. SID3]MBP0025160.1 hypothetical protein [Roseofilum sp. SID2]MBP0039775.1 hypothetical protein [Roseofilum sp. SID1]MBP0044348.1 hypothetical protein [Roseofilum sp. SBFL]